jgi:hypothetical protein
MGMEAEDRVWLWKRRIEYGCEHGQIIGKEGGRGTKGKEGKERQVRVVYIGRSPDLIAKQGGLSTRSYLSTATALVCKSTVQPPKPLCACKVIV